MWKHGPDRLGGMAEFDVESLFRSLDTDRANVVWKWKLLEELKQAGSTEPPVLALVSSLVSRSGSTSNSSGRSSGSR